MTTPRSSRMPLIAASLCVLACSLVCALSPASAWAEAKTFSQDDQLSADVYSSLGLKTSDLDDAAATETAPFDLDTSTMLLSKRDTYVAANGSSANNYTLRRVLNRLDDDRRGTGVYDDYGSMVGAYEFYKVGKSRYQSSDGHRSDGALSDNATGVAKRDTGNGFSGKYATSVEANLGSGWKDHVVELRALGDNWYTMFGGVKYSGGFLVKVMKLDEKGNRSEVSTVYPYVSESSVWSDGDTRHFRYLDAGYIQELDAALEIEACDVDDDGVDEVFAYTGCYVDRGETRYAVVDMFDFASDGSCSHSMTELDAGPAELYPTKSEIESAARSHNDRPSHQYLKMAPVVTLAGGDLDRKGGDEIAMAVSAPTDHDAPGKAARCYLYTWDAGSKRLAGIDGLNKEIGGDSIPLWNANPPAGSAGEALVSANCAFGTFTVPETGQTTLGLVVAGWDCEGDSHISKGRHYSKAGYRYVYYDPAKDSFAVSGYKTRELGRDASHIVDTATRDASQDQRYAPTLAPLALGCARLQGLHQAAENDQVLFGGEVYEFALGDDAGLGKLLGSISMCSNQQNENSNTKGKEQVWIGDVVAGNVSGSESYEESFLAVIGVHRDEDLRDGDDYYWMDVAHFTAKFSGDKVASYQSAQEGVVCEGNRKNETYGTWVSLCLPNASHRGVMAKFESMAKYYTAPQALAMLEDAPYFQDLQDSYHYLVLGGTGFGRSAAETDGDVFSIDANAGLWGSYERGKHAKFSVEGELQGHFTYESQTARTLEYSVSYESHAGEGNKVVAYAIPVVYYQYKVSDLTEEGGWEDVVIPVFQEPTTSVVSAEVWDGLAGTFGGPKTQDVFGNKSGNPSTYTAQTMAKLPTATRAFTSENSTTATNSQGATVTQEISTEREHETTLGGGVAVALQAGGGAKFGSNILMGGVCFDFCAAWADVNSSSRAFTFEGAVDNLPEEAQGYAFSWKLAVNKSHAEMAQDGSDVDDNQFWIVGYEVDDVTPPANARNAVSGLAVTAASDHSITLAWDDVLQKGGAYNYGVAMVDGNGTLADWEVVPSGTTSFEWGGEEHRLNPATEYRFAVAPVTGSTAANARQAGVRSGILRASTLPSGDVLTVNGAEVTKPAGSDRNAKVELGGTLAMRETATYLTHDVQGNEKHVTPKFTWYRVEPYGNKATRVGTGSDTADGESAGAHVSSFALDHVTPADDGSVWYCNVSYNNVVVSSQRVNLDVTGTVVAPGESQLSSGFHKRAGFLRARAGGVFAPTSASAVAADPVEEAGAGKDAKDGPAKPDAGGNAADAKGDGGAGGVAAASGKDGDASGAKPAAAQQPSAQQGGGLASGSPAGTSASSTRAGGEDTAGTAPDTGDAGGGAALTFAALMLAVLGAMLARRLRRER